MEVLKRNCRENLLASSRKQKGHKVQVTLVRQLGCRDYSEVYSTVTVSNGRFHD